MKRTTKTVEKRTFALKNAIPMFVSLVARGANLTPLSELRYSDNEKFSEVEINRIEFSKEDFDRNSVEQYLKDNDYVDYSIEETETLFVVPGVDSEEFSDISPIEYSEGVKFYIGKLKEPSEKSQPNADVVEAEILDFEAAEQSETEVKEEVTNEETISEEQAETSEDFSEGEPGGEQEELSEEEKVNVEAAFAVQIESTLSTKKYSTSVQSFSELFDNFKDSGIPVTFEAISAMLEESNYNALSANNVEQFKQNCNHYCGALLALSEAQKTIEYSDREILENTIPEETHMTKEQVIELFNELFAQKESENEVIVENTIDETEIVVQNSQVVQVAEFTDEQIKDEPKTNFNKRVTADLFGIR